VPHYYERLTHRGDLWPSPALENTPMRPIDLRPEPMTGAGDIAKLDFHITDYLPYANLQSRWIDTGANLNPYLRFHIATAQGRVSHELLALDPDQQKKRLADEFEAEFHWATTAADRSKTIRQPKPEIVVRVASKNVERKLEVSKIYNTGAIPIEGTDYTIELDKLYSEGAIVPNTPPIAALKIKHGSVEFERMVVAGDPGRAIDLDADQKPVPDLMDADLKITYLDPSSQRLLLVAGQDAATVDVVFTRSDGTYRHYLAKIGEPATLLKDISLTVDGVLTHAVPETRPDIVPREQRQSLQEVGKSTSLVRVEVGDGRQIQSTWLQFSQYAFNDDQRAEPERFRYAPRAIRLSDGRTLWLLYSRWRDPLPSPVALDRFILQTYPGGYPASDYISMVRFAQPDGDWSPVLQIKSNHPAQHGEFWYFQAQWDPGVEAHTVLGVGNRRAVRSMLAGVCISITGMIYAFYFKPVIIRRRKQAALAAAAKPSQRSPKRPQAIDKPEVSHV
jgi:hypothetical protein